MKAGPTLKGVAVLGCKSKQSFAPQGLHSYLAERVHSRPKVWNTHDYNCLEQWNSGEEEMRGEEIFDVSCSNRATGYLYCQKELLCVRKIWELL